MSPTLLGLIFLHQPIISFKDSDKSGIIVGLSPTKISPFSPLMVIISPSVKKFPPQ